MKMPYKLEHVSLAIMIFDGKVKSLPYKGPQTQLVSL